MFNASSQRILPAALSHSKGARGRLYGKKAVQLPALSGHQKEREVHWRREACWACSFWNLSGIPPLTANECLQCHLMLLYWIGEDRSSGLQAYSSSRLRLKHMLVTSFEECFEPTFSCHPTSPLSLYLLAPSNSVVLLLFISSGVSRHALLLTPCLIFLCDLTVIYIMG